MNTEMIFWTCGLAGSAFFVAKVMLSLVFGASDHAAHGPHDIHLHDAQGTEDAFKYLSLFSISAFVMTFGWAGLAGIHQLEFGIPLATIFATAVGGTVMYLTVSFFRATKKLTSPGAQFSVDALVGMRGTVYQRIPGEGAKGVIHITVEGVLREVDAQSENDDVIDSFSNIEVVRVAEASTVVVKKI